MIPHSSSIRRPRRKADWDRMKSRSKDPRRAEFEAIYERHSREVWALVYARWLNAEIAQDILQEAFLRLWKQLQEQTAIDNPRAWLLRVARNLAEDFAKSSFRRNGTQPPESMNAVAGGSPVPLEKMEQSETFAQVNEELGRLGVADREILTLRYALDYDAGKIAEILDINTTAVHMRLSRARQRLAERLTARGIKEVP
jgi:RNA polymerase sigma-70 factor (ECF subfamily)